MRNAWRNAQTRRTLSDELLAAGYNPLDFHLPGSFTLLAKLTLSPLPSELSDLSDLLTSPSSTAVELGSDEEVECLITLNTAPTTSRGVTTRLQARAQQAQAQVQAQAQAPQQPTTTPTAPAAPPPPPPPQNQVPAQPATNTAMANQQPPQVPMQGQKAPMQQQQQQQQQQQPAQANPPLGLADMLARGERSVPFFDNTQPEEQSRYFADLQFLLNCFQVVDENEHNKPLSSTSKLGLRASGRPLPPG